MRQSIQVARFYDKVPTRNGILLAQLFQSVSCSLHVVFIQVFNIEPHTVGIRFDGMQVSIERKVKGSVSIVRHIKRTRFFAVNQVYFIVRETCLFLFHFLQRISAVQP